MGIQTLGDWRRYGLTLVLGGGEVSLLDLTSAYGVFANEGVRNPYATILRIEERDGTVIREFEEASEQVLAPNTARVISDILSDNDARQPSYSANSPLYLPGYDVAAKTGTTNDFRDTWIMGYTPTIAVGAWAGNNDNSPIEKKVAGLVVAPMWNAFMREALRKLPTERFNDPEPIDPALPPYYRGYWQGGESRLIETDDGIQEEIIPKIHSILYWLGRTNDPQYSLWEEPIQTWAKSQKLDLDDSPRSTTR